MPVRLSQSPKLSTAVLALALTVAACGDTDSPLSPEAAQPPAAEAVEAVGTPGALLSTPGILFSSSRTSGGDIYRMNPDGTGVVRVTSFAGPESSPAWSWDHKRIAMVRQRLDASNVAHADIYLMNADGTGKRWALAPVLVRHPRSILVEGWDPPRPEC